jgi:hypothetical protein
MQRRFKPTKIAPKMLLGINRFEMDFCRFIGGRGSGTAIDEENDERCYIFDRFTSSRLAQESPELRRQASF